MKMFCRKYRTSGTNGKMRQVAAWSRQTRRRLLRRVNPAWDVFHR